ncbi:MarR family winged helix-turn-helix transcriptional regulator [Bradyrhizobium sp. 187]|jgi:MarR family transcriptional regulator for hemolysin|uniref:MarR family winged helix-turn-helix transcriptional regulator n=1 Tax=Bradyrhizobium sp. 187 TaxID=2782655 RepID=UPI001FFEFB58|nr:MarR family winged helix-turn-helix transcriptional regulator [Bradyrhizobium sp. 187]UPJ71921.1 winged helix-turn-helix transcriptional regulator [Bradyrhizobium sp. 187]
MEVESPTLGFLLHEVARLLRKRFEQISRESGLTRSQWQALAYLAQNEGINQSGLAELLDIEPITLSRILDKLEACVLIERHPDSSDRRVRILRLAPAARPKLMQARKLGEITRREGLTGLSEADGLRLLQTLRVLKFNLTEACDFGGKAEASKSWVVPAK